MLNHNKNLFLIVSACLAFLKGKVAHLHSAARALSFKSESVFSYCQQILTKIFFVVFCAEMLLQFSPTPKRY